MADISKITLPSGTEYNLKDAAAREAIDALSNYTAYLGVTSSNITDGDTTNPVTINNESVTATVGCIVTKSNKEFIFNGTSWQEFGDLSGLGALAYKSNASGNITPAGTVSQPTFEGDEKSVSVSVTAAGTVSKPAVDVTPTSANVAKVTANGTAPSLSYTVQNEVLTISWNAGSMPTFGTESVLTGVTAELHENPTFTGSQVTGTGTYTPEGIVTQPTFTGTQGSVTVS